MWQKKNNKKLIYVEYVINYVINNLLVSPTRKIEYVICICTTYITRAHAYN